MINFETYSLKWIGFTFFKMLSKNQIKHIKSLNFSKYRKIHQEFIAEGSTLVLDILNSSFDVKYIYATQQWFDKNKSYINNHKINIFSISEKELQKISNLKTPNNVLSIIKIPDRTFDISLIYSQLILMLDEIKNPGNLGTIIRTSDWFGMNNIICSRGCVDIYNPKVVQSTMGSITRVNVYYTDLYTFLKKIKNKVKIYGTSLDGERINSKKLYKNGIIIIGNESRGINKKITPFINQKILIPSFTSKGNIKQKAESLNASLAAAITCYEFRRQQNI